MRMVAVMVDCEKLGTDRSPRSAAMPVQKAARAKAADGRRSCLACGQGFASDGPHERICAPCKDTEEWRDLAAAAQGHILW
jgi:hypothetical protein